LDEPGGSRRATEVPVTTIDNFASRFSVPRIDLMKIDIEGNELHALRGAQKVIECDHPAIIMELNPVCLARDGAKPEDLFQFLRTRDYSIRNVDADNILALRTTRLSH
jgi:Methyltransferase FkbM domain